MKSYITLLFLCFSTLGCAQSKSKPITEFSQNDINDGILIDVRTPKEFEAGHLINAVNIDWFADDFTERCTAIDKEKTVYVYCKKGGRSAKAAEKLGDLGFTNVVDLIGGYDAVLAKKNNRD